MPENADPMSALLETRKPAPSRDSEVREAPSPLAYEMAERFADAPLFDCAVHGNAPCDDPAPLYADPTPDEIAAARAHGGCRFVTVPPPGSGFRCETHGSVEVDVGVTRCRLAPSLEGAPPYMGGLTETEFETWTRERRPSLEGARHLDVERLRLALDAHMRDFTEQPESFDESGLVADNIARHYLEGARHPEAGETDLRARISKARLALLDKPDIEGAIDVLEGVLSRLAASPDARHDVPGGLDVERLSIAMNRATVYGTGTAEQVAAEYARLGSKP